MTATLLRRLPDRPTHWLGATLLALLAVTVAIPRFRQATKPAGGPA